MSVPAKVFHVAPEQAQQTLSALLRGWMEGKPWSQVRKLIQGRHVQVNGNLCLDEARKLKPRDVVKVLSHPQARPPRQEDVKIRFIDRHVVVVEKPAGVTTLRHIEEKDWPARRKQMQPTLDELLNELLQNQQPGQAQGGHKPGRQPPGKRVKGNRKSVPRVRPVHRLDRETSGLMVFARSPEAEQKLVQMFRKHTVHRLYWALCLGQVQAGTIESSLVRDRGDGKRGSTKLKETGQHAVTHVRPLEDLKDYTLVECRLETGRTHQIRIHLAENGHMLCGEKTYHTPLFGKAIPDKSGAPRIALHAAELGFEHPVTGEQLHWKMPLPPDMVELLKRLRAAAREG